MKYLMMIKSDESYRSQKIPQALLDAIPAVRCLRVEQVAEVAGEVQEEDEGELRHLRAVEAARGGKRHVLPQVR